MFRRILISLLKPLSFLPALLMMSMIFSFSAQNGAESSALSQKVTKAAVITWNHIAEKNWSEQEIEHRAQRYEHPVRKLAHMSEYCLLAITVALPLYVYGLHGFWLLLVAGFVCVAFAAGDEFHQSLVANRTPSVRDVCIDSIGVLVGIMLVRLFCWIAMGGTSHPGKRQKKRCR